MVAIDWPMRRRLCLLASAEIQQRTPPSALPVDPHPTLSLEGRGVCCNRAAQDSTHNESHAEASA